jgi:Fe-S oxidoreductase
MLNLIEIIVFTLVLAFTFYVFFKPLILKYQLIKLGKPENRYDSLIKRFINTLTSFFFLTCSVKKERKFTGFMHIFLLYGSLTFDTVSVSHIIEGFNKDFHIAKIHALVADIFSVMVLVAVLYFIIKRYIFRPKSYTYTTNESAFIYALLITVTLTFLLYEGSVLALKPGSNDLAFLGNLWASWLPASTILVSVSWWLHILNVFVFIMYVPRSKYLHMFVGPINILFRNHKSNGIIRPIDIENAESFGVTTLKDFRWKDLLDGFACIDCGRCEDYCPASKSGKPLNPKEIILNMRDNLMKDGVEAIKNKDAELPPLMGNVFKDDEIWTCTSCGACMYVCPVQNEHLNKIIELRQSRVLMEANFPQELNQFFKNIETNSNPWGFGSSTRGEWAEDKEIKTLAQDQDVDVLLWVGCAGSFDDKGKKVSAAMVNILKAANIKFGILGKEENCCGDQARRLGNEYLFQTLAQQNIEVFKKYNIKKILVTCPHGYHTFKNEYPELSKLLKAGDWDIEVVHHTEFINELISNGKLKLNNKYTESLTYHDPCYLGRHNDIIKQPRKVLSSLKGSINIKEMKNHKYHSSCCGAGGGLMWTEEHLGERINHQRTDEAINAGADTICTSCPFCMTMLDDGIKDKGQDEKFKVKDLAEIVSECL